MARNRRHGITLQQPEGFAPPELYSDFYENAPDLLFSIDAATGRILQCNSTAAVKLGYAKQELLGRKIFNFYHKESRRAAKRAFKRFVESGSLRNVELKLCGKDGNAIDISLSASAVYEGSKIVRSRSICRDITELKHAQTALQQSENEIRARAAELSAVLDAVPAMIFIAHDRDCKRMTSSQFALELLKLPPGGNASKSAPEHERPSFRIFRERREVGTRNLPVQVAARTGRRVRNQELEIRFSDSSRAHVFGHAVPLEDPGGDIRGAVGAFVDISERKRAEFHIAENEARFRKFIESNIIGIVTSSETEGIRQANDVFLNMLGFTRRRFERVKLTWADLTPAEHMQRGLEALKELKQTGTFSPYETEYLRKDGSRVPVLIGGVALSQTPLEWMRFVLDLTKQKKIEADRRRQIVQQLLLEREVTAREAERSRIARELHDELGQLLASLLAGLLIIEDSQTVAASRRQARKLQGMVALSMEELERIARGLHVLALDDLGLGAALRNQIREYAKLHNIRAEVSSRGLEAGRLPKPLEAGIYRIVQEALTNTARHAGARRVRVNIKRTRKQIVVEVSDDGCGFDAGMMNVDGIDHHLGIQGMQERATMMGGTCSVKSAKGEGTTILLAVPIPQPSLGKKHHARAQN